MNDLVNNAPTPIERGISALKEALGEDAVNSLLQSSAPSSDEAASYYFTLPEDYMGVKRKLRIGFPKDFPSSGLKLKVEPSPWLQWPHAMESGLCLHGFKELPVTGTPEYVVKDNLARLRKIVHLSLKGSCSSTRDSEFEREITSYWSRQQGQSKQNIILLNRPQTSSRLFALSDPRQVLRSRRETVWLSADLSGIKKHYKRTIGRSPKMRALHTPGFYAKLQSYPALSLPSTDRLFDWLLSHLSPNDQTQLLTWFSESGSLPNRWIALELPGNSNAPIYCLNIRSFGLKRQKGSKFYLRSARRTPLIALSQPQIIIKAAPIDVLDREEILSRDMSGVTHDLEKAHVVCIGVGSLGSSVAVQLARSGVGFLTLIDPDHLVSANIGRHVLGADDLGVSKAEALQAQIRKDIPTTEVTAFNDFSEIIMKTKPKVFDNADLVLITTADWHSEAALWTSKAQGAKWSVLQAWSEPNTIVGHALLAPSGSYDGRDLFNENGDFKSKFTEWPDGGNIALRACGESFIPGGFLGIVDIASMVSQSAIRLLTGKIESPTWISRINHPQNVIALGGRYRGPELPEGMVQVQLERNWPDYTDVML